ncbi:MAG: LysE family translocator, partial [Halocynthiibacter sp.]
AISAAGFITSLPPVQQAVTLGLAFSGLNLFVCVFWSFAGSLLAYLLNHDRAWAIFMRAMAAALAVTAFMVFL